MGESDEAAVVCPPTATIGTANLLDVGHAFAGVCNGPNNVLQAFTDGVLSAGPATGNNLVARCEAYCRPDIPTCSNPGIIGALIGGTLSCHNVDTDFHRWTATCICGPF